MPKSPRSKSVKTSSENAEKVVNPPKIPVITNGFSASNPRCSDHTANAPITNDPMTLTDNTASGRPVIAKRANHSAKPKRRQAPMAPPRAT